MKTIFSKKSKPDPELLALKAELQEAQGELSLAYRRFDQALDPELVESCVYQISAVKAREPEAAAALSRAMSRRTCGEDEEGDALWT